MTELTAREDEVRRLVADRLSNDDIADRLGISRRTVEAHLHTVFRKTGVSRRSQLVGLPTTEPEGGDPRNRDRLRRYDELVHRLVDRHFALFDERVELAFVVGARDGADRVVERRWTTPRPYLVYRTARPIVDPYWEDHLDPDELELSCTVLGKDVQADALAVTEPDRRPLAMVVFQPGLQDEETEWTLSYRSDRLWDPLRATGEDRLGWSPTTSAPPAAGRLPHRQNVTELAVRMQFPPDWTGVGLAERSGLGIAADVTRLPSGQLEAAWRDPSPATAKYEFHITGTSPGT